MSRWVLPRSSYATINLPRLVISSHQMTALQQRCINTFGSLLSPAQFSPLSISLGDFVMERKRPVDEEE
jgi:hypothetical protein